ncbi:unnamed protein product [Meganyctiphanes norvegica]|uniref:SH2 domain-containing protein n=1 Tax=Meganyctiphanes norvegica TaxID=48144 RepID=A0AAV2QKC9_MEGNR
MGRLKTWGSNLNPLFSGKYKKLLEEYGTKDYSRLLLQDSLQDYLSYACRECGHVQKLQADELNSIVGQAFRLAYAAHLQKSANASKFDHVNPTSQHLAPPHTPAYTPPVSTVAASHRNIPTHKHRANRHQKHCQSVRGSSRNSSPSEEGTSPFNCNDSTRTPGDVSSVDSALCKPTYLPGLHSHTNHQQLSSPGNSNGPTELNISKRLEDKHSRNKKHHVKVENKLDNLLSNNLELTLENNVEIDDESQPLVTPNTSSTSSSCESLCHQVGQISSSQVTNTMSSSISTTSTAIVGYVNDKISVATSSRLPSEAQSHSHTSKCNQLSTDSEMKRTSQISVTSSALSSVMALELSISSTHLGIPPPLPDRTDSLTPPEEPHLKSAAWFQAGIPREIALEVLSREPVGAFMVRESTSKPGCFALSLRVPRDFTVSGIAHYLIVKNSNGYKIKGFTKEFTSLTALITHHSVMPELLPCPLSLSRYSPNFTTQTDQTDDDPDYNTLSDFRKIMADLNV